MELEKVFTTLSIIKEASAIINQIYIDFDEHSIHKKEDESPVTEADFLANDYITSQLLKFSIPIISEENTQTDFSIRSNWEKCWILDPLDGTKEFIKKSGEFAICLALVENGKPIFGFIASPVEETILFGGKDFEPQICSFDDIENETKWRKISNKNSLNSPLKIAASISHFSDKDAAFISKVEEQFPITYSKKGSALKFFDLAEGSMDLYPRFSPTMEWDIAAGQAILEALGGGVFHAETLEPLTYNKEDLYNPPFIACTKHFLPYLRSVSKL